MNLIGTEYKGSSNKVVATIIDGKEQFLKAYHIPGRVRVKVENSIIVEILMKE